MPSSSVPIWLDDLGCTGTETRLVSCNHPGVNVENCAHSKDIGLVCHGNPTSSPTTGECRYSNISLCIFDKSSAWNFNVPIHYQLLLTRIGQLHGLVAFSYSNMQLTCPNCLCKLCA